MDHLFSGDDVLEPATEPLAPGAVLLRRRALAVERDLLDGIAGIAAQSPFLHMVTPGGHEMSVAMTSCGSVGWVSDVRGYRYSPIDPQTGQPWPAMPDLYRELATQSAAEAGFDGFDPDACLINRYEPGAKMSLYQDRDEAFTNSPIVSVSLGIPATFLFGGLNRTVPARRVLLQHGDIVVWGGPSRIVSACIV